MTAFEQTEILDYPEIWFLGLEAKKIEGVPGGAQNNGYDDENGSYIKVRYSLIPLCWKCYPDPHRVNTWGMFSALPYIVI